MVEANDYGGLPKGRARAGQMLAQQLGSLSLDARANKLASFVPQTVLYDEALSATQVTLVKDEETDLVSRFKTLFLSSHFLATLSTELLYKVTHGLYHFLGISFPLTSSQMEEYPRELVFGRVERERERGSFYLPNSSFVAWERHFLSLTQNCQLLPPIGRDKESDSEIEADDARERHVCGA